MLSNSLYIFIYHNKIFKSNTLLSVDENHIYCKVVFITKNNKEKKIKVIKY